MFFNVEIVKKSPCKMFRHVYNTRTGDMAELVECARLEIVYTGNCIEGSNPPISATIKS